MNSELLERSILGTMLSSNYLISDSLVSDQHFTNSLHQSIYISMKRLKDKGQPVDAITLISDGSNAEIFGDLNYITALRDYANVEKFDSYVEILLTAYQQRNTRNILQTALNEGWELEQTLSELNMLELHTENDAKTAYEMATEIFYLPYEEALSRKGVRTGLQKYDLSTGGLVSGELTIIAARPSLGKTDVLINFAIASQNENENVKALIFSLEMSNRSVAGVLFVT